MTSDAKIGLLLGLVFIFIIAFIINGLPTFRGENKNNELIAERLDRQHKTPGIGGTGRDVIKGTGYADRPPSQLSDTVQPTLTNDGARFEMPLPEIPAAVQEVSKHEAVVPPNPQPAVEKIDLPQVEAGKPALPQDYVVAAGDNLGIIAKRFYGAQEGNRIKNINRIFEANRGLLNSPDAIYEGQKIVIPALTDYQQKKTSIEKVFPGKMVEIVKSIGRRYTGNEGPAIKQGKYVVREGDNLWKIAAAQLGDGGRYREIYRLNADKLENEHEVVAGMSLTLPVR